MINMFKKLVNFFSSSQLFIIENVTFLPETVYNAVLPEEKLSWRESKETHLNHQSQFQLTACKLSLSCILAHLHSYLFPFHFAKWHYLNVEETRIFQPCKIAYKPSTALLRTDRGREGGSVQGGLQLTGAIPLGQRGTFLTRATEELHFRDHGSCSTTTWSQRD